MSLASALAFGAACGGATTQDPDTPVDVPKTPPAEVLPENAAELCDGLTGARVRAWIYPARATGHPLLPRILALPPVKRFAASWDPTRDLEQVYVSAPGGRSETAVVFGEHRFAKEDTDRLLTQWITASDPPGTLLPDTPFPTALLSTRGRGGLVAFAPPRFVIALPRDMEPKLGIFQKTGGLGEPKTQKAALVVLDQPAQTLAGTGVPKLPPTITVARAEVELGADGGAVVTLDADSTTPEQANEDARYLTRMVDRLTSVQLGPITIRAFKKVDFVAEASKIKSRVPLTRGELELGLTFLERELARSEP